MEKKNSVHIHDVPISISVSHLKTKFPFISPLERRNFPIESWSQSGKKKEEGLILGQ